LDQISAWLLSHQITAPIEFNTEKPTRDGSQWFIAKKWMVGDKEFIKAWAGDYKRGLKVEWSSHEKFSKAEMAEAQKQLDELLAREKAEREEYQISVALQVIDEWEEFAISGRTPYMERKQIKELYGARIKANPGYDPILAIEARDIEGRLWNYQRIYSQKLSAGDKFFVDGARLEGLFAVLNGHDRLDKIPAGRILLCEGFATAASIQQAMGPDEVVVASFNANNLLNVSTDLREKFPAIEIIICADNDAYTSIDGKPYNVGLEKARRAASACRGKVVWPIFKFPQPGLTDFNDLHCAQGIDTVKDQIEHPEKYITEVVPLIPEVREDGSRKKLSELAVVRHLLNFYGENICKFDKSIFKYVGTHWREFTEADHDQIKNEISIAGNGLVFKDTMNAYKMLLVQIPHVPRHADLFKPDPFMANFKNGTLHVINKDGKKTTEFRPHNREDYLTSVLPFNKPEWKPGDELPPAPKYQGMIERLWSSNPDKQQVHDLSDELIGACLMPAFPVIAFFFGAPNSGKSTFIKLLVKIVGIENTCQVQLTELKGFNLETMVGKLVNFDTDIDTHRHINDSATKKLIDRSPVKVQRKGRVDIYGHVPAVHLFAGNNLPSSIDGESRAYSRRMIFVKTSAAMEGRQAYDFEQDILDTEMPGLIARGLRGLHRLLESGGLYTIPDSSTVHVEEMQEMSDVIGQFIDDAKHNELQVEPGKTQVLQFGPNREILSSQLWTIFNHWQTENASRNSHIGKHKFIKAFEKRGFHYHRYSDKRVFKGLGFEVENSSVL
jgi:phage/plasmid primase-like uncharacterized protein/phage/plasmid-associated DNA primase